MPVSLKPIPRLPPPPRGSQAVWATVLRSWGQTLERWADRLEATLTQVTATLPAIDVRHDGLARLWRLWLTAVAFLQRSLPRRWGEAIVALLPLVLWGSVALSIVLGINHWTTGKTVASEPPESSTHSSTYPSEDSSSIQGTEGNSSETALSSQTTPIAPEVMDFSASEVQDPDSSDLPHSDLSALDSVEANLVEADSIASNLESSEKILKPTAPPSPLEQTLQAKLQQGLTAGILDRIAIDFAQQRLTIYLTPAWENLSFPEQQRLGETLGNRSQHLDFPQIAIMDAQGHLRARRAIVGQGMIWM